MPRLLLVWLLLCAGVAPTADAATCKRSSTGPARTIAAVSGDVRSHVTVCDRRRGRARVIARGTMRASGGRRYTGAWTSRRHLVDVQVRAKAGRDQVIATVRSTRTLRVVRRVVTTTAKSMRYGDAEVVLVAGDAVAIAEEQIGVYVERRGAAPRRLGDFYDALGVEDGVTLRWDILDGLEYRDVGTPRRRDGCPLRRAFAEQARGDRLIVTESATGGGAIRVCDRTTGKDPVVRSSSVISDSSQITVGVVGLSGTTALLGSEGYDRYTGCGGTTVTVLDALTGRELRQARTSACDTLPRRPAATVVTPQGAAAWLGGNRLVAINGADIVELDKGTITDLAPTADGVRWTSNGTPKSATLA